MYTHTTYTVYINGVCANLLMQNLHAGSCVRFNLTQTKHGHKQGAT